MNSIYYDLAEKCIAQANFQEALAYYLKGEEIGDVNCINALGYCYDEGFILKKDEHKAFAYYQKAASLRSAKAQYNLSMMYQSGNSVVSKDLTLAIAWCKQAAMQEEFNAIKRLAYLYKEDEQFDEAIYWYQRSYEAGNSVASILIAKLYDNMDDVSHAYHWYEIAAKHGYVEAQTKIGFYYKQQEQYSKAVYWLEKAVAQHDDFAISLLAACYMNGQGVPKDSQKAMDLLTMCQLENLYIPLDMEDDEDEAY